MKRRMLAFLLLPLLLTAGHQLQVSHPIFTAYSQHKYNFNPLDSYFERWIDRPLLLDPGLNDGKPIYEPFGRNPVPDCFQQFADYKKSCEVLKSYGFDGFSYLGDHYQWLSGIYRYADRRPVPEIQMITVAGLTSARPGKKLPHCLFSRILKYKGGLQVKGKYVVEGNFTPEQLAEIRKTYGDRFLFIAAGRDQSRYIRPYLTGTLTEATRENLRQSYRDLLKYNDGIRISCSYITLQQGYRRINRDFMENFVYAELEKVLSEPAFKHKYLAVAVGGGHENTYLRGYMEGTDGTRTLRYNMEQALKHQADFISLFEWDEVNENTHIQPTVYSGYSTKRIMRYYTAVARKQALTALPGDNLSVPNLCLSYRRMLSPGEQLKIEVLNIPDGSSRRKELQVGLRLYDLSGRLMTESTFRPLQTAVMEDVTFTFPSEKLASSPALQVELVVKGEKEQHFREGLHPIEICGAYHYLYTYVRQPLRDLLKLRKLDLQRMADPEPGTVRLNFSVETDENIAAAELIDQGVCVWTDGDFSRTNGEINGSEDFFYPGGKAPARPIVWRENPDYYVLQATPMSVCHRAFYGSITVKNADIFVKHAPGKWSMNRRRSVTVKDGRIDFRHYPMDRKQAAVFIAIPRSQGRNAVLTLDFPGIVRRTVTLPELLKLDTLMLGGPGGTSFALHRYLRQYDHPLHLKKKSGQWEITFRPNRKGAVCYLQLIAESGRIWRSAPLRFDESTVRREGVFYSETTGKPVRIRMDALRLPRLQYRFREDLAVPTDSGRAYWGVRGGIPAQANLIGSNESDRSLSFNPGRKTYPRSIGNSAPEVRGQALHFNGQGEFLAFPQGWLPRRAGFRLSFVIRPDEIKGRQMLFANMGRNQGGLYEVYLDNGRLKGSFSNDRDQTFRLDSGLTVNAGKDAAIELKYDLKDFVITVNGHRSAPLPAPGPGWFDMPSVFGYFDGSGFTGTIRDIILDYSLN